jgi:hypothetical protein
MLWGEIKRWSKELGYEVLKEKSDEYTEYYWSKISNPQASGIAMSVSKLAIAIFNDHTNGKWVEHQKSYFNEQRSIDV